MRTRSLKTLAHIVCACVSVLFAPQAALAAPSPSACTSGDVPGGVYDGGTTFDASFCQYYASSPPIPDKHWQCTTTTVCGAVGVEAYAIHFSGSQWVAWADCDQDGTAEACTVMPYTTSGGVPETEGIGLAGTTDADYLFLSHGTYNLEPISSEPFKGWLYGDLGIDELVGSNSTDSAYADYLRGGGDGDTVYGGDGNDDIQGNDGDDLLHGEDGVDRIEGGAGVDRIYGDVPGSGYNQDDVLFGGSGADEICGGGGADSIDGGADDDTICGDRASGPLAAFTCSSESAADGDDNIRGGTGVDTIETTDGLDRVCDDSGGTILLGRDVDEFYATGSPASLDCETNGGFSTHSGTNCTLFNPMPTTCPLTFN